MDVIAAQKKLSEVSLATQPGQAKPVVLPTSSANLVEGRIIPGVKVVPDEVTAGVGGLTAGTHPGFTRHEMPGMGTWKLPSGATSEALEDLDLLKYAAIFGANKSDLAAWLSQLGSEAMDKLGLGKLSGYKGSGVSFRRTRRSSYGRSKPRRGGASGSW